MTNQYPQFPQHPQYNQPPVYHPQPMMMQQTTVVDSRSRTPHTLHLILTLITFGLWLPIWIIDALIRGR